MTPFKFTPSKQTLTLAVLISSVALSIQVNAETVKKPVAKTKSKSKASTEPVKHTTLNEMVVNDTRARIDNWLTEDTRSIPVQKRTVLGRLTKTAPIAGSIIDRQEFEKVKYVNFLQEQLNRVPGMSLSRNLRIANGGKAYTNNLIDGLNVASPTVGNMSLPDTINPMEVESIEVIRGPSSVLYPSNGITGTINTITKDPSKHLEYSLSQEIGMYDLYRTQGAVSGTVQSPINDIGYFAGFNVLLSDPWKDRSKAERYSGTGKLVLHPDDVSKLTLRFDYTSWYQQDPGTLTPQQWRDNWRQANPNMLNLYQDFQYITGVASYKRQFGKDGELEVSFSRRDKIGTDANPGGGSAASSTTQQEVSHGQNNAHVVYRQDFDWVKSRVYTGVDVINGYQDTEIWNRPANGFNRTTKASANSYTETQVAPFMQYEFTPLNGVFKDGFLASLDNLRFNFGLRYEDFQQHYYQTYNATGGVLKDRGQGFDKLIKKGGLSYEYVPDHTLWFGMADGWLVPGASTNVTAQYPNDSVTPENSITKQLGLRGFFREQHLSYDITAYETNIDNYISTILCSDNPSMCGAAWKALPDTIISRGVRIPNTAKTTASYTGNSGKATIRGFETSLAYQPHEMVKFSVAHTLNWNVFNNYNAGAVKLNGVTMAQSPKHHVNGRITVYPVKGLNVELEADYLSRYYTNVQNTDSVSRPMLFHLRSSYQWQNWTLSLQALNLLNTKYVNRVSANAQNVQTYNSNPSDGPFQFRAGIEYKF